MRASWVPALLVSASILLPGCSKSEGTTGDAGASDATVVEAGPAAVSFPSGFLWGASTAAFQVEANDLHTDWSIWAATPGKISTGDSPNDGGPDSLDHMDDDIAAMKAASMNAYRFSVEWGRIYPTLASFTNDTPDPVGIGVYDTLLGKLQDAGITPVVTLHHFASPDYLSNPDDGGAPQAWERPEMVADFATFCSRMAARWGDKVDWWITVNEPVNLALGGYFQGSFPPGAILAADRLETVVKAEAKGHAAAYDAIHAADTIDADGDGVAARVSLASHQRTFHAYVEGNDADVEAAARVEYVFNDWFLNAVVLGNWDDDFDGNYTGPNDSSADPSLRGRADFIGVNYYSDTLISASRGLLLPVVDAAVYEANLPTKRPKTEFGWDIYPEGLGAVLDKIATYKLPLMITENGLADAEDKNRSRFILEHLYQAGWAIERGVPLLGYFHWALVDNFEWANGYCPHFGLMSYDKATGARQPRASMGTYQDVITGGAVTLAQIQALPAYVSATSFCE